MTAALRLVSPSPTAPTLGAKPAQWRGHVEALTHPYRRARAKKLLDRGRERAAEAMFVRDAIVEGYREELGLWPLSKLRALPGGSPDLLKIIRHWDRAMQTASGNTRRLIRAEREPTDHWARRVLQEAERRVESLWHQTRAGGQLERFQRVAKCGEEVRGVLVCGHCSTEQTGRHGERKILKDLCGSHLLCARCRKLRGAKYRSKIFRARHEAIKAVRRARLGPGVAQTDPICDRFLTLTCPHLPLDAKIVLLDPGPPGVPWVPRCRELAGPEAQAWIVRHAVRPFLNALRGHWRARGPERLALSRYVRVIEATEGRDSLGHIHVHAWLLSPFVRVHVYRALWGRALVKAGFPLEHWPEHAWAEKPVVLAELELAGDTRALRWATKTLSKRAPWPRVDIRRVYARGDSAELDAVDRQGRPLPGRVDMISELVKYLVKDWETSEDGSKTLIHPMLFAAVYRGLDQGRMISASRDFWVRYHAECQHCGAQDTLRPVKDCAARPPARAPPLFAGLRAVD